MLHPHIQTWIVEAKRLGMTTSIVSNGTRMNASWLKEMAPYLDWLGLSIDASSDELHAAMGRGRRGELKREQSHHLKRCREVLRAAKEFEYGIKLNTVVSSVNALDSMASFVREWRPDRWKIFQALPIQGENDADIEALEVSDERFQSYLIRHKNALSDCPEVVIVGENNDAMRGTYAMIDPLGLVYTNAGGRYLYSAQPVHSIGFAAAWAEVAHGWSEEEFQHRQGMWNWSKDDSSAESEVPSAVCLDEIGIGGAVA